MRQAAHAWAQMRQESASPQTDEEIRQQAAEAWVRMRQESAEESARPREPAAGQEHVKDDHFSR
jgi:hypothetical protein